MPMSLSDTASSRAIAALRAELEGAVITPDDPRYDAARTVYSGRFDRRPALIARPRNVADVVLPIRAARENNLPQAICSGGHSIAGHSTTEGGVILDLHDMKSLKVDAEGRTAWAETGLTVGEYSHAVSAYGLNTGFGDTGSVGIGGLSLAGGMGYLSRKYGAETCQARTPERLIATPTGYDCCRLATTRICSPAQHFR